MKKQIPILLCLLTGSNWIFGQICGTRQPVNPTVYPQESLTLRVGGSSATIHINIFFHIVRNTDGTKAYSAPNIVNIVGNLTSQP